MEVSPPSRPRFLSYNVPRLPEREKLPPSPPTPVVRFCEADLEGLEELELAPSATFEEEEEKCLRWEPKEEPATARTRLGSFALTFAKNSAPRARALSEKPAKVELIIDFMQVDKETRTA